MGESEVDLRINETLQPGAVRRPPLPGWVEFGAVMNPHLPGTCRPIT